MANKTRDRQRQIRKESGGRSAQRTDARAAGAAATPAKGIAADTRPRPRRMPILVGALILVALLAMGLYYWTLPAYRGPARHVIVISLDTTRADHLGCYGNKTVKTPHLDKLAAESILFTDAMTVVPTTLNSHTSLFTGKYPHHHGVPRNGHIVNQQNVMLAEVLKQAGFHTAAFLGSYALDGRFGMNQGFDYYEDDQFSMLTGVDIEHTPDQDQRRADAVTDSVIAYLDKNGVPDNLFLFAHYFDSHAPYDAPPPYDKQYAHPKDPGGMMYYPFVRWAMNTQPEAPHPAAEVFDERYKGEITYLDHHVGRLLDDLRKRGILDHAVVIVVSDHGEDLSDHFQYFDHGYSLYQSTLHIVSMVRLPGGLNGGKRIDSVVANIDFMPSLLKYMDLPAPQGMDGGVIDFAAASVPFAPRAAFAEATKPQDFEKDPRWINIQKARCIRMRNYKFVYAPWNPAAMGVPMPSEALYDLASDPTEQRNLLDDGSAEMRQLAAEMKLKLETWARSADPLPTQADEGQRKEVMQRAGGQVSEEIRNDVIRRLAALGYADGLGSEMSYADANSLQVIIALERLKELGYTAEQIRRFKSQTRQDREP